jgi:hypothetical protein
MDGKRSPRSVAVGRGSFIPLRYVGSDTRPDPPNYRFHLVEKSGRLDFNLGGALAIMNPFVTLSEIPGRVVGWNT